MIKTMVLYESYNSNGNRNAYVCVQTKKIYSIYLSLLCTSSRSYIVTSRQHSAVATLVLGIQADVCAHPRPVLTAASGEDHTATAIGAREVHLRSGQDTLAAAHKVIATRSGERSVNGRLPPHSHTESDRNRRQARKGKCSPSSGDQNRSRKTKARGPGRTGCPCAGW